jgi:hypothetical protein
MSVRSPAMDAAKARDVHPSVPVRDGSVIAGSEALHTEAVRPPSTAPAPPALVTATGQSLVQRTRLLQRRMLVGAATDPLEVEAEQVADAVLRSTALTTAAPASLNPPPNDGPAHQVLRQILNRKTALATRPVPPAAHVHRAAAAATTPDGAFYAPPVIEQEVARGGGALLDAPLRREMEAGFGADFGSVRIHHDDTAAAMNRELQARAFTAGSHIYLGQHAESLHSTAGRHLLAHELTHVLQQTGSATALANRMTVYRIQRASLRDQLVRGLLGVGSGNLAYGAGLVSGMVGGQGIGQANLYVKSQLQQGMVTGVTAYVVPLLQEKLGDLLTTIPATPMAWIKLAHGVLDVLQKIRQFWKDIPGMIKTLGAYAVGSVIAYIPLFGEKWVPNFMITHEDAPNWLEQSIEKIDWLLDFVLEIKDKAASSVMSWVGFGVNKTLQWLSPAAQRLVTWMRGYLPDAADEALRRFVEGFQDAAKFKSSETARTELERLKAERVQQPATQKPETSVQTPLKPPSDAPEQSDPAAQTVTMASPKNARVAFGPLTFYMHRLIVHRAGKDAKGREYQGGLVADVGFNLHVFDQDIGYGQQPQESLMLDVPWLGSAKPVQAKLGGPIRFDGHVKLGNLFEAGGYSIFPLEVNNDGIQRAGVELAHMAFGEHITLDGTRVDYRQDGWGGKSQLGIDVHGWKAQAGLGVTLDAQGSFQAAEVNAASVGNANNVISVKHAMLDRQQLRVTDGLVDLAMLKGVQVKLDRLNVSRQGAIDAAGAVSNVNFDVIKGKVALANGEVRAAADAKAWSVGVAADVNVKLPKVNSTARRLELAYDSKPNDFVGKLAQFDLELSKLKLKLTDLEVGSNPARFRAGAGELTLPPGLPLDRVQVQDVAVDGAGLTGRAEAVFKEQLPLLPGSNAVILKDGAIAANLATDGWGIGLRGGLQVKLPGIAGEVQAAKIDYSSQDDNITGSIDKLNLGLLGAVGFELADIHFDRQKGEFKARQGKFVAPQPDAAPTQGKLADTLKLRDKWPRVACDLADSAGVFYRLVRAMTFTDIAVTKDGLDFKLQPPSLTDSLKQVELNWMGMKLVGIDFSDGFKFNKDFGPLALPPRAGKWSIGGNFYVPVAKGVAGFKLYLTADANLSIAGKLKGEGAHTAGMARLAFDGALDAGASAMVGAGADVYVGLPIAHVAVGGAVRASADTRHKVAIGGDMKLDTEALTWQNGSLRLSVDSVSQLKAEAGIRVAYKLLHMEGESMWTLGAVNIAELIIKGAVRIPLGNKNDEQLPAQWEPSQQEFVTVKFLDIPGMLAQREADKLQEKIVQFERAQAQVADAVQRLDAVTHLTRDNAAKLDRTSMLGAAFMDDRSRVMVVGGRRQDAAITSVEIFKSLDEAAQKTGAEVTAAQKTLEKRKGQLGEILNDDKKLAKLKKELEEAKKSFQKQREKLQQTEAKVAASQQKFAKDQSKKSRADLDKRLEKQRKLEADLAKTAETVALFVDRLAAFETARARYVTETKPKR